MGGGGEHGAEATDPSLGGKGGEATLCRGEVAGVTTVGRVRLVPVCLESERSELCFSFAE